MRANPTPTILAVLAAGLPLTSAQAGTLFLEDFEELNVVSYEEGTTPLTWVRASAGYNSHKHGLTDKAGGDFAAPAGNDQAYAFRYTNSGITSAEGELGPPLVAGGGYEVSFDVVRDDGLNAGTAYTVQLIAFGAGAARNDCRSTPSGSTVLASAGGSAPSNGSIATVSFSFIPDAVTHAAEIGKDLGIRVKGSTTSAIIDNITLRAIEGTGPGLDLVSTDPADETTEVLITEPLRAIYSKDLVPGTGNVTLRNLTDSVYTPIPVGDPQITLSGVCLEIRPTGGLQWGKDYAVRIDAGTVEDAGGTPCAAIIDDTTWNFSTAGGDPLFYSIAQLTDHINGVITLTGPEIEVHKVAIDASRLRFDESVASITAVLGLVAAYDSVEGPLFVSGSTVSDFSRNNTNPTSVKSVSDQNIHWAVYTVMQYIMDDIYHAATLADPAKRALLDGYLFGSSADFPGAAAPPADPNNVHTATINGSFPISFGRDTQQWTLPARKPTGTYLPPGTIATVTVPPALVGQGYQVRVGAHSWDMKNRPPVKRLERATLTYDLDATSIEIASPYGGGIYVEVPMGSALGVVDVDITGAVRSPYFSVNSVTGHTTTDTEWQDTERNHPGPWADFQTEKFMMQVHKSWVDAVNDPTARMAKWDDAMDAINDLMGFPQIRGKETMYIQTDVIFRSSVHAPGYPATNVNYNPKGSYNGDVGNYFVQGPESGASTEFHEQGHAYGFPKFGGETEANVNLLYVPVLNRKFGHTLDAAFRKSIGFPGANVDPLDKTAVLWMTSFNFAPREQPMGSWEKAYQPQGHSRWVDIARLFGWDGMGDYWSSFMEDDANNISYGTSSDDLLLRLCKNVGEDIRPLFHFWGIHPQDPVALAAAVQAEGLTPAPEIYNLLQHYRTLVPADNTAYQDFCIDWYSKSLTALTGYGVEREHCRQWDNSSYWLANEWQYGGTAATNPDGTPIVDDGEIYLAASATRIETVIDNLIDLYFTDYDAWAALYPGADLGDPDADLDGDGLTNREERIWGLDPTDRASHRPLSVPLDANGEFSYTRRDDALTGLTYSVWTSTDLDSWDEDTGATLTVSGPDANGVETVEVTLTPALLSAPELFVRVGATE